MPSPADTQRGPLVYRREDYIGGFRHLVVFAVDSCVLLIMAIPLGALSEWLLLPFAWYYLAVLKPSRYRSPGYWVTNAKIITLDGQRPSPFRMTLRLFWMATWTVAWPISFLIDWVWTSIDDERQMLRDLFSGTRLVRNSATPLGVGRIVYVFYSGAGLNLTYAQVRPNDRGCPQSPVLSAIESPTSLPESVVKPTVAMRPHDGSIVPCPNCGMRVVPKPTGQCPSCQTQLLS
jgi:uncharacterized RDD family membrane protein YckC